MKKLIFLFAAFVLINLSANAQCHSSKDAKAKTTTETVEVQNVSAESNAVTQSKANCMPVQCKKGPDCCKNKSAGAKNDAGTLEVSSNGKKINNAKTRGKVSESKLQVANTEMVKEQPAPKE